ncbi:MAG TPA: hypothetical protein VNK95_13510 [Caldilineaceae bacterium]|nr:hypothetical protein [Caldilineaceae bacterium]
MITPNAPSPPAALARQAARPYDELNPFYRALWGEHLHHGLWLAYRTGALRYGIFTAVRPLSAP